MADISSYSTSSPVTGEDKWIGTSSSGSTKNFKASDVAAYINGTAPGTVTTTTSTSYTLVLTDANVVLSGATATGVTVPLNSSVAFPIGTAITLMNGLSSVAAVTVTGASGVTLRFGTSTNVFNQYLSRTIKKVATDTWFLY
jgi:hypothetical protein